MSHEPKELHGRHDNKSRSGRRDGVNSNGFTQHQQGLGAGLVCHEDLNLGLTFRAQHPDQLNCDHLDGDFNVDDQDIQLSNDVDNHGSLLVSQRLGQLDRLDFYQDRRDFGGEVVRRKQVVEVEDKSEGFCCCHLNSSSCSRCQWILQDRLTEHHCRCCAFRVLRHDVDLFCVRERASHHNYCGFNVDDED